MVSATTGRHTSTAPAPGTSRRATSPTPAGSGSIARSGRFVRRRDALRPRDELAGEAFEAGAELVEAIGFLGRRLHPCRAVEAADEFLEPVETRFERIETMVDVGVHIGEATVEIVGDGACRAAQRQASRFFVRGRHRGAPNETRRGTRSIEPSHASNDAGSFTTDDSGTSTSRACGWAPRAVAAT